MSIPPKEIMALARSLYLQALETDDRTGKLVDTRKKMKDDWKAVVKTLRKIQNCLHGNDKKLTRGYIDSFLIADLQAYPSGAKPRYSAFSIELALAEMLREAEFMAESDDRQPGSIRAAKVLLDWYSENVETVTAGGSDRNGDSENEDGSGVPIVLSKAEKWLLERLKEIDPDVSARAAQSRVSYYLKRKA